MKGSSLAIVLALVLAAAGLAQDAPKKVSRSEALSAVISKVQPDYPHMARQLRVEGTVELEALVSEDGKVVKVNIVSGNPMLTAPSADAVKAWKFKPFAEDGKPVKALAPITVIFKL